LADELLPLWGTHCKITKSGSARAIDINAETLRSSGLGHSTITTTMNTCSHVTPTMQKRAIDRFAAHLGETPAGA
jgi:hypothetical protein